MATSQQYSLRWNNYLRHITYAFDNLRTQDDFVDVTLCCEGRKIKAHKVLLSACSGYFKEIFKETPHPHPVIIFKFIKFEDLNAIIEFMYQGEVNVQQEALQSFLQTAELLAVQGLTSEEKEKPKTPVKSQLEQRIIEEQIVKSLPTTIRTVAETNTQTSPIDIQANVVPTSVKKRKITFSDDDDGVYTETVEFPKEDSAIVKTTEMQYLPTTVKMDIPEYIDVSDANNLSDSTAQVQQSAEETAAQFTSEYEILTESEIEEKFQQSEPSESTEITTVELGRVFTTQTSTESGKNEKSNNSTQDIECEKLLKCNICKRQLQSISALKRHNASKHSVRLSKHDCSKCKKSFKTKWSLSTHNSRFHRQRRPLKECIKMEFSF